MSTGGDQKEECRKTVTMRPVRSWWILQVTLSMKTDCECRAERMEPISVLLTATAVKPLIQN